MKILNPKTEIHFRDVDPLDKTAVYQKIEQIARLCYKSEDKITDTSFEKMLQTLNNRGHFAMLEHQVFVMEISSLLMQSLLNEYINAGPKCDEFRRAFKYISITNGTTDGKNYISGSATGFKNLWITLADGIFPTLDYICNFIYMNYKIIMKIPEKRTEKIINSTTYGGWDDIRILSNKEIWDMPYENRRHHDWITTLCLTDRGVTHEIVRHRPVSYAHESTRYCNYGKDDHVKFILPSWIDKERCNGIYDITWNGCLGDHTVDPFEEGSLESEWFWACANVERTYQKITTKVPGDGKLQPQQSRAVLNNSLKTEIYVTCPLAEWEWFMKMRIPNAAHPDMRQITRPLQKQIKELVPEFPMIIHD